MTTSCGSRRSNKCDDDKIIDTNAKSEASQAASITLRAKMAIRWLHQHVKAPAPDDAREAVRLVKKLIAEMPPESVEYISLGRGVGRV